MNGKSGKLPPELGVFEVKKDIDGAIVFSIGAASCKLAPKEAIQLGVIILNACGCNVDFKTPAHTLIIPPPPSLR